MEGHLNSLKEFEIFTEALKGQQQAAAARAATTPAVPAVPQPPLPTSAVPVAGPAVPPLTPAPPAPHGESNAAPGLLPPPPPTFAVRPAVPGGSDAPLGIHPRAWNPGGRRVLPEVDSVGIPLGRQDAEWAAEAAASIVRLTAPTILNERHVSQHMGVPLGAIITPVPDLEHPPPRVDRRPACCINCGAAANLYCKVDLRDSTWDCLFCGHQGRVPVDVDPTGWPDYAAEVVDYWEGGGDPHPMVRALVVDITPDAEQLEPLKQALWEVLDALPDDALVAILTFDSAVRVYDLAWEGGATSADVLPGHCPPSPALLQRLREGKATRVAPLRSCRAAAQNVLSSLMPASHDTVPGSNRRRCLGAALLAALEVVTWEASGPQLPKEAPKGQTMNRQAKRSAAAQIMLIATGPGTLGPGSIPQSSLDAGSNPDEAHSERSALRFFDDMAARAVHAGISVDVVGVGPSAVNAAMLGRVAHASGGAVMLHEEVGPLLAANLGAALQRRVGAHGVVDFYASPGVDVVQIIGPVTSLDRGPGGPIAVGAATRPAFSGNACQMPSVERSQAIGLALDLAKHVENEFVYLQVAVGWTDAGGQAVQRIVTRRMRMTKTAAHFLREVDVEAAALLLARNTVLGAQRRGAASDRAVRESLRRAIGKHLTHVASRLGEQLPGEAGWFGRRKHRWKLPWQLRFFAEALYQLQRGPLLGDIGSHPDERAALQAALLSAPPDVGLHLLAPALHVINPSTRRFEPAPPADLALPPDSGAVLDCGNSVYVLLGAQLPEGRADPAGDDDAVDEGDGWSRRAVRAACMELVGRLSAGRFPVPEVRCVTEGSPDARYVTSRVFPLHHDTEQEQVAQLPALLALSPEARAARRAAAPTTNEPSFLGWCRSLSVETSVALDNVTQALEHMQV